MIKGITGELYKTLLIQYSGNTGTALTYTYCAGETLKCQGTSGFCGWELKMANNSSSLYLGALGQTNSDFCVAKANGYFSDHMSPAISVAFVILTISTFLKLFFLASVIS